MSANQGQSGLAKVIRTTAKVLLVNAAILIGLLIPVELAFGTWIRPMALSDLRRFSIPLDTRFEFDTSSLYSGGPRNPIISTRDQWGLRGSHKTLAEIDVLTVGGSTTEQRFLDDTATWQAVAQRELALRGKPLVLANAGVDGQSTVGHAFNFDYWFPLLPELHPKTVLFYVGINDVLRHEQRVAFDSAIDARSWRVRSATYLMYRTIRSNLRARQAQVSHGRLPPLRPDEFTEQGLLTPPQFEQVAGDITAAFLANVDGLKQRVVKMGAEPVFMTQTALGWNADGSKPRGRPGTVTLDGVTVNFADVAAIHQHLNRSLMAYCDTNKLTCFDLATDVAFDNSDYYDYLHNTPHGAEKIGKYLADRLAKAHVPAVDSQH